jgi:chromosome segregation ATPase
LFLTRNSRLQKDVATLEEASERLKSKGNELQRKYAEEKSQRAAIQRTSQTLQAENNTLRGKIEVLEKDLVIFRDAASSFSKDKEKELADCNMTLALKSRHVDGLKSAVALESEKQAASLKTISERDKVISEKEKEKKHVQLELDAAKEKISRIIAHNQRLCQLGESLLAHLDGKGIFKTVLEKEPFTKTTRIELEKMIQDYLDQIDKERLTKTDK